MDEDKLRKQGARCMDCGVPFCHTGTLISGMASGCPINNLIPEWNDLVYRGLWREALDRLHKTNNFPEFTGRVCPAPCEGSCVLGITRRRSPSRTSSAPSSTRVGTRAGSCPRRPRRAPGRKSPSSAPAPRAFRGGAAQPRRPHRHGLRARRPPGGLLMYGIPNMKLDKQEVVMRRIELMEEEGIKFICNANVGENVDPQMLRRNSTPPSSAPARPAARPAGRGPQLKGVHFAMEYLTANTKACSTAARTKPHSRARQGRRRDRRRRHRNRLRRHGHAPGLQEPGAIEILPQAADGPRADNPWPEWPKVYKLDYGQEEAAAKFGADPRVPIRTFPSGAAPRWTSSRTIGNTARPTILSFTIFSADK
jgi:glutamate synthase (NADPH/NADH) small chain